MRWKSPRWRGRCLRSRSRSPRSRRTCAARAARPGRAGPSMQVIDGHGRSRQRQRALHGSRARRAVRREMGGGPAPPAGLRRPAAPARRSSRRRWISSATDFSARAATLAPARCRAPPARPLTASSTSRRPRRRARRAAGLLHQQPALGAGLALLLRPQGRRARPRRPWRVTSCGGHARGLVGHGAEPGLDGQRGAVAPTSSASVSPGEPARWRPAGRRRTPPAGHWRGAPRRPGAVRPCRPGRRPRPRTPAPSGRPSSLKGRPAPGSPPARSRPAGHARTCHAPPACP